MYQLPDITLEDAKKGSANAALDMQLRLYDLALSSGEVTADEKVYYKACRDKLIKACALENPQKKSRAVSSAIGLSKKKGGQENDLAVEYPIAKRIDDFMRENGCGPEQAIHELTKTVRDPVLATMPMSDCANFRRIYYKYKEAMKIMREERIAQLESLIGMHAIN